MKREKWFVSRYTQHECVLQLGLSKVKKISAQYKGPRYARRDGSLPRKQCVVLVPDVGLTQVFCYCVLHTKPEMSAVLIIDFTIANVSISSLYSLQNPLNLCTAVPPTGVLYHTLYL